MKFFLLFSLFFLIATNAVTQSNAKERLELKRLSLENQYRSVGQFDPVTGIATVYDDGKMGFIDTLGKLILPPGEYVTSDFSQGIGIWKINGTIKAINKLGQVVNIYAGLENMIPLADWLFKVSEKNSNGKFGIMNAEKKIIVKNNYSGIERISGKYYKVTENGIGQGVINNKGDTIIPLKYILTYIDTNNLQFIGNNRDIGYAIFNVDGSVKKLLAKEVYVKTYQVVNRLYAEQNGVIIVGDKFSDKDTKYALVNTNFDTIIPLGKYFHLTDMSEGLIKFSDSVSMDRDGKRTNPYQYVKCGFLNAKGDVVIPSTFDFAHYFTEGLSGVKLKEKWGFINKTGQIVIPLKYDYVLPFRNGFAKVKLKGRFYIIDKKGKIVLNSKSFY